VTEYGIDVSYHNGLINWAAVAADGITYATIKATSGEADGGTDSPAYFRAQAPAMAQAIPLCGGYHWLKPIAQTSAAVQVQTFLDVMREGLGGHEGHIVQLDVEEGMPADVRAWKAEWDRRTDGYPVALYLPDWLENQWGTNRIGAFGFAAWWSSEYVTGSQRPYRTVAGGVTAAHWHSQDAVPADVLQFTSTAHVDGVSGNCDVNIYRGTLAQLTALLTREGNDMAFTNVHAEMLENLHRIVYEGKRKNDPQTSGGGIPIAYLVRALGELGSHITGSQEALLAKVDGVAATEAQILAAVGAIQTGDPDVVADAIVAKLGPAQAEVFLEALRGRLAA
jgi:lysozyme